VRGLEAELKKPPTAAPAKPQRDLLAGLHTPPPMAPLGAEPSAAPAPEELAQLDFCLDQGMVVDAAELLQTLEAKYPDDADVAVRRARLEGAKAPAAEEPRPALQDILSEDLELVLDAELGRALTDEMARSGPIPRVQVPQPPAATPPGPAVDESGLFSDEQEFFNFAEELQSEMKQEPAMPATPDQAGGEVSLEEIFREFKKGVEQQLSPEDYETHYNLGIAYKEMGLTDEAIGEFQLASKDPLHAVECCSMLGLCFLEKGLPQLAIKWYKKGLETIGIREEDRLGLQYDLATVYVEVGDRDSAYKTFLDIYGSNAQYRDVGEKLKELAPA
jgi:tetratricopeptide (TPR) repeat protein